jgi:MoxR-like ATPase
MEATSNVAYQTSLNHADAIREESIRFHLLSKEVSKVIVGNKEAIDAIILGILCKGHILLEGLPGVAKTTMITTLTQALGLSFKRIQFTPDLLPSDVVGTSIYNQKIQEFEVKKGPIFANLVLADEINRAPAKVQSALLECMQERQVTIGNTTYKLDTPFLVFATQNPIEQEGTYRLLEAQLDRFLFKIIVGYPTAEQEKEIINLKGIHQQVRQVLTQQDILRAQELVEHVYVDEKIKDYIVTITDATRDPAKYNLANLKQLIVYGVSPRATLALYHAVKAYAFFVGKRHFVLPDDVKALAPWVLRHRLALSYVAESNNITADTIIKNIISAIPTP